MKNCKIFTIIAAIVLLMCFTPFTLDARKSTGKTAKTEQTQTSNKKKNKKGEKASSETSTSKKKKKKEEAKETTSSAKKKKGKKGDSESTTSSKKKKKGEAETTSSKKKKKGESETATSSRKKKKGESTSSDTSAKKKKRGQKEEPKETTARKKKSNGKQDKEWNGSNTRKPRREQQQTEPKPAPQPRKKATPKRETPSVAQNDSLTMVVNNAVLKWIPETQNPGGLRINSVTLDNRRRQANVSLNDNFTYLPINQKYIGDLKGAIRRALPDSVRNYSMSLKVGRHDLSYYISRIDKLPEEYRQNPVFIKPVDPWSSFSKGLNNDNIALWHSHGRYYRNDAGGWLWQRGFLYETIEDVYTMSYVLPYLVPMLENAGANVFLPRERDINRNEVIVDNDTYPGGKVYSQTDFRITNGAQKWTVGKGEGFIYDLPAFRDTENPFTNGTYMEVPTISKGKPSVAAWYADIPKQGDYAVYVSYKTLPNSTTDAHYTVNYSGGSREFTVNQKMGGGTWIYLGTFPFKAGASDEEPVVALTNLTNKGANTVVTADAIKIGGGMGNIERSARRSDIYYDPSTPDNTPTEEQTQNDQQEEEEDEGAVDQQEPATPASPVKKGRVPSFKTSGLPRYLEGARYWLHWAGFPESVYSPYHGKNDYKDDYTDRGHWVNYLAGGSRVLPKKEGMHIPIDLSFALHSDAGKRSDDSFVGTLGIYYTNGGSSYTDGTPRMNSRMLTDVIMKQITGDIRHTYEPRWTRRPMWDRSYLEARVPEVPATLIELMSHQNYADMMYGMDPNFRFSVGRAIYKGMARFLAERKGRELVIQPLPVKNFAITKAKGRGEYELRWDPTPDKLEPTAMPNKYVILERTQGELGFRRIAIVKDTHFKVRVTDKLIHSFKIVAVNDGGLSFDSEVLALRDGGDNRQPVMIVNGFTRISGPEHYSKDGSAGFKSDEDFGVPYIRDIHFTGYQTNFNKASGSAGASGSSYVDKVIAGNTFDFVALHGVSIESAGYSFVSCSAGAVEKGDVKLEQYKIVDLILGKQKTTTVGNGKVGILYEAFPAALQQKLRTYIEKGGHLFVSGQYIGSDVAEKTPVFAEEVLGIIAERSSKPSNARIEVTSEGVQAGLHKGSMTYSNTLNEDMYIVENPDVLHPSQKIPSTPMMIFSDNGNGAAMFSKPGHGKVFTMSVPFESIKGQQQRDALMKQVLHILE